MTAQDPRECKWYKDRFCHMIYDNGGYWVCCLCGRNPHYESRLQGKCPDFAPKNDKE